MKVTRNSFFQLSNDKYDFTRFDKKNFVIVDENNDYIENKNIS